MKKTVRLFKLKGFTMIELLIVIAVLGILAVAVLSAINPIEQVNRARDTGNRSDAEQLLSAIDRFYTTSGYYPWRTGSCLTCGTDPLAWTEVKDVWLDFGGVNPVLTNLSTGGSAELKSSFVTRLNGDTYNSLFVYNQGTTGDSTYVCFLPASGAFELEATNRCLDMPDDIIAPALGIICPVAGSPGNYSCLP